MPVHRCEVLPSGDLPAEAGEVFHRDGVLIIEGFKSRADCETLRSRANELVMEHGPKAAGAIFSTKRPQHQDSQYFVQSAYGIGTFFEEEAFDAAGKLAYPLPLAVNKLGHGMHDLDPVFSKFSKGPALQAISESLGVADPRVMQSMYIFKQPNIGGEVICHQDSTYLYTQPMSVIGYWFAIDDAHIGNGCLGGLPGEHRKGLKTLFRRQADGRLETETVNDAVDWDMAGLEWLEVPAGTLIVFSGCFPHLSNANRSSQARHAYTLHVVDGACDYPADNWLQRPAEQPARGFL
ncbi:MAG TPA: phytanoyl-CoA dioxygenase family protein [Dongiaceae bacterium]